MGHRGGMEETVQAVLGWATKLVVERGPEIAVAGVMIVLWRWFMGHKYQRQIDALRAGQSSPVTVNVQSERPNPQGPALIDPTAQPRSSGDPNARLRALEPLIESFARGRRNDHVGIWELHLALGEIGIAWPGPGVTPEFRRLISTELLAACRSGDLEGARTSWARVLD